MARTTRNVPPPQQQGNGLPVHQINPADDSDSDVDEPPGLIDAEDEQQLGCAAEQMFIPPAPTTPAAPAAPGTPEPAAAPAVAAIAAAVAQAAASAAPAANGIAAPALNGLAGDALLAGNGPLAGNGLPAAPAGAYYDDDDGTSEGDDDMPELLDAEDTEEDEEHVDMPAGNLNEADVEPARPASPTPPAPTTPSAAAAVPTAVSSQRNALEAPTPPPAAAAAAADGQPAYAGSKEPAPADPAAAAAAAPTPAAAAPPPPPKPAVQQQAPAGAAGGGEAAPPPSRGDRPERRVKMTRLRLRVAERLKGAQNTYAMLTTFNEVDMTGLMEMRNAYKDVFLEKHGVKLGFMSAFVKAAAAALQEVPAVNAVIDGSDIIYRDYTDISIAVATPKGLVVPVLRSVDKLSFAEVEKNINALGRKARDGSISIDDMAGGTFTISNGGVYGSMLSTPIINPPQSAILGMHNITPRAMVVGKGIEARPMMYIALTYDHRLIDGREAVTFLKRVKEVVEDPRRLLLSV